MKFFVLDKEGTRRIDIIPFVAAEGNPYAEAGELHYERTFFVHRGIGPNQDTYVCPARTAKKPCPVCEHRSKMAKDPDADEQMIKDLAPKERQLWNVIDVEDRDSGVQLWDMSFHLFGKLLDAEIKNADEDEDFDAFFHLEDGQTLKLGVGERSFAGTTFCEVETIGFKQRRTAYGDEVLEQAHCLDEILLLEEYDKLKAIFLQTEGGDDDDIDDAPTDEDADGDEDDRKEATAGDLGLKKGDAVLYEGDSMTITKISRDGTSLTLEDEDGDVHRAVAPQDVKKEEPKKSKPKPKPKSKPKKEKTEEEPPEEEEKDDDDDDWDDWDDD